MFKVVLMRVTPWRDQKALENISEYRAQRSLPDLHRSSDLRERLLLLLFSLHNKTSNVYVKTLKKYKDFVIPLGLISSLQIRQHSLRNIK